MSLSVSMASWKQREIPLSGPDTHRDTVTPTNPEATMFSVLLCYIKQISDLRRPEVQRCLNDNMLYDRL